MMNWRKINFALSLLLWASLTQAQAIAANVGPKGPGTQDDRAGLEPTSASSPTPVPGIYGDETYGQLNLVTGFGADSTGLTDSTAAVQAFISAIEDGFGGVVPPGTYSISSTITITGRDAIRVAGLGAGVMGATIFRWDGASGGIVFALSGVSNSYFRHFAVQGGSGSVGVCFALTDAGSNRFVDVGCERPTLAAFQLSNSSGGTSGFDRIEDFDINCSGGDGIQILSSSSVGHDFVDGAIANCATGVNAISGAFISENLSFSNNKIDVHLGSQNGSTGLYTPQSINAGQFLVVDPTDALPIKIEGGQILVGADQSGYIIDDAGSGPLVLSNDWFASRSAVDSLQVLVGHSTGNSSAVSIGNVYPGGFPLVGPASISSLGDVSASLGQLPARLGAKTLALTVQPSSIRFPNTIVHKRSSAETVLATNTGSVAISLKGARLTGDFHRSGGSCGNFLRAHKQCTDRIVFAPVAVGSTLGKYSVDSSGTAGPQTVLLFGVGLAKSSKK